MTVAGQRYIYQKAPWNAPLSLGQHALIEYNGYVFNDRYQSDRIRITNITGLDDADISDSREAIPGDHGENVYDALYRGRTFVMSGRIEAGSLGTCEQLQQDLKAAFAPLIESPMKFRWFDITDGFNDPQTLLNYTAALGGTYLASITPVAGVLRWNTTQQVMLLRTADNRLWGDKQAGLRLILGSIDASASYVVLSYKDANNYVVAGLYGSNLKIYVNSAGTLHQIANVLVSGLQQGRSVWLQGRTEGDLVTAELWMSKPVENSLPDFYTTAILDGADADNLGDQVLTQVGFGADTASTYWAYDDFNVKSLSPCDVIFNVRKMPNGMSIKDSQDSLTRFNRAVQITVRAGKSFGQCATQSRSQVFVPTPLVTPTLGFSFPLRFPLRFRSVISGPNVPANTYVTVNNRGPVWSRPRIVVYGATGAFTITNLQNGQQITWSGTLSDGDYLVFDCESKTLVNSTGANMMKYFSSTSSWWMWIDPGPNDLVFVGSGYSVNTKMVAYLRASFT